MRTLLFAICVFMLPAAAVAQGGPAVTVDLTTVKHWAPRLGDFGVVDCTWFAWTPGLPAGAEIRVAVSRVTAAGPVLVLQLPNEAYPARILAKADGGFVGGEFRSACNRSALYVVSVWSVRPDGSLALQATDFYYDPF